MVTEPSGRRTKGFAGLRSRCTMPAAWPRRSLHTLGAGNRRTPDGQRAALCRSPEVAFLEELHHHIRSAAIGVLYVEHARHVRARDTQCRRLRARTARRLRRCGGLGADSRYGDLVSSCWWCATTTYPMPLHDDGYRSGACWPTPGWGERPVFTLSFQSHRLPRQKASAFEDDSLTRRALASISAREVVRFWGGMRAVEVAHHTRGGCAIYWLTSF
jgi:hypothetical protein